VGIGAPIANTEVYVLDAGRQPVPVGVVGDLYIGGLGVARGYLGRPELTAERFVPDALGPRPGGRLYRTGDLARWRSDGTLDCLGRDDTQVKVRGFRIELGEIEVALAELEVVRQAVVVVRADTTGEPRLVAYLVFVDGESATASEVRKLLRRSLPEHMIPNLVVELEQLPLTQNGKIDRNALPDPFLAERRAASASAAPARPMELLVAGIWREALGC